MINLLNSDNKRRLRVEQLKSKILVVLLGATFCLAILNSLNFGLWLLFHQPADILSSLSLTKKDKEDAWPGLDKVVSLADWWPKSFWFEALNQARGETLSVFSNKQFSGTWDTKKNEKILVWRGEIAKREDLVSLVDRLRSSNYFAEVNLPFDNLVVSEKQDDFAIQLKLKTK